MKFIKRTVNKALQRHIPEHVFGFVCKVCFVSLHCSTHPLRTKVFITHYVCTTMPSQGSHAPKVLLFYLYRKNSASQAAFSLLLESNQQISTKKSASYMITRSHKQVYFINKQKRENLNVAYLLSLFTQKYFSKGSDNHKYPIKGVFTILQITGRNYLNTTSLSSVPCLTKIFETLS